MEKKGEGDWIVSNYIDKPHRLIHQIQKWTTTLNLEVKNIACEEVVATYSDIVSSDFYIAHRMAVVGGTSGEAAVLADRHLFHIAVIESVFVMVRAAPGPDLLSRHQ